MIRQPGMDMNSRIAATMLADDSVETEVSEKMLCAVDMWSDSAVLEMEDRPGCIAPSPVLYITGHVMRISGAMLPSGATEIVYAREEVDSDDDQAAFSDTSAREPGDLPLVAARGPEVRFRFEFTPVEKAKLAEAGLFEPGFEMPAILTNNKFEDMPIECRFMTVKPQGPDDVPFVFCEIPGRACIDTSSAECGYRLADYFEESEVMRKFKDVIVPAVDERVVEQAVIEHMEENLFAGYQSAAEEVEAAKLPETVVEADAKELDAEHGASDEKEAVAEDAVREDEPEDKAKRGEVFGVVHETPADLIETISAAFKEGRPADKVAERDAARNRQRNALRNRQAHERDEEAQAASDMSL